MIDTKTISLSAASVLAAALLINTSTAQAEDAEMEKCAGIVKAGQNDCAANGHACAGYSETDNDPNEWIYVPEGTCEKITGGKTVES